MNRTATMLLIFHLIWSFSPVAPEPCWSDTLAPPSQLNDVKIQDENQSSEAQTASGLWGVWIRLTSWLSRRNAPVPSDAKKVMWTAEKKPSGVQRSPAYPSADLPLGTKHSIRQIKSGDKECVVIGLDFNYLEFLWAIEQYGRALLSTQHSPKDTSSPVFRVYLRRYSSQVDSDNLFLYDRDGSVASINQLKNSALFKEMEKERILEFFELRSPEDSIRLAKDIGVAELDLPTFLGRLAPIVIIAEPVEGLDLGALISRNKKASDLSTPIALKYRKRTITHPQIEDVVPVTKETLDTAFKARHDGSSTPNTARRDYNKHVSFFNSESAYLSANGLVFEPREGLLIGPGPNLDEILATLKCFPSIETLHVVNLYTNLIDALAQHIREHPEVKTRFKFYAMSAELLPTEFAGFMDLAIMKDVVDFDSADMRMTYKPVAKIFLEICRVLKKDGVFFGDDLEIMALEELHRASLTQTDLVIPLINISGHALIRNDSTLNPFATRPRPVYFAGLAEKDSTGPGYDKPLRADTDDARSIERFESSM